MGFFSKLFNRGIKSIYASTQDIKGHYKTIEFPQVKEMLDKKEAVLLDVRNLSELDNDGYIKNSMNIPLPELQSRLDELDKEKTYITFCAVGGRSLKAAAILANSGFQHIYNSKEGMKTWPYEKLRI